MSTQGSTALEKAEVHTESIQQVQPIDLASGRNAGGQVVQLRPVRAFSTAHVTGKSVGGGPSGVGGLTAVNAPIISVNRPGNLTLLPTVTLPSRAGSAAAAAAGQPGSGSAQQVTQAISTYQIARVGNMRSATLATGQQPASITVTPISASNFSANIRLTGATVNNGSWIQTNAGAQGTFGSPLRGATITVGGRPVRQDTTKMIHLPQQGSVQHVAQLQMVDGKGSLLKPGLTTPLMNIRGALQGGAGTGQPVTLPIAPFTIRTANITNIPAMQQRPQTSTTAAANQVQKVITQSPHGTPIQFVNAGNKNVIQAITTPLPRLNVNAVNAVCLTLSTNAATLAPNSSSPAVAVASKQGATSLIMTPSLGTGGLPLTKVIPVGRDGSASIVDSLFAQPNSSTSNAVTVSAVSASGTQVSNNTSGHGHMTSGNVVLTASPSITTHGASSNSSVSISQSHHLLHVQGPINVHPANTAVGLPPPGIGSPGSLTSGYFVEKNGNLSLLPTSGQSRPITLEKRMSDGKSIAAGSMILTTQHPHIQSGGGGHATAVTIPIAGAHGTQHVSFAHPLSMSHSMGQHQLPSSAQIITTPISAQAHHIASTVLSTMSSTPTISVSASSQQMSFLPGGGGLPHSIPTHVISQPQSGPLSIGSSASNPLGHISVSTSMSMACSSVSVTNSGNMPPSSAISVSVNPISSIPTNTSLSTTSLSSMSTTTTTSSTMNSNSNSLSTAAPAQSPNKSTTHSPRPSILRKQREFGDNHHIPPRSQRNLTLQLNYTGNNNSNSSSSTSSNITSASSVSATTATSTANKENAGAMERGPPPGGNNNGNTSSTGNVGVSILRKEFQPPNEESSWQSCSSHSSGSTTISATSETAEFQLNQGPSSNTLGGIGGGMDVTVNVPLNCESGSGSIVVPSSTTSFSGNTTRETVAGSSSSAISQNGLGRSGSHGRGVHRTSSKVQNRDLERIRREKEDSVSPRKKPRKQQLTTSDFIEAASPEISFYQGRGKKFRRMENNIFDGYNQSNKAGVDPSSMEDSTPPKVVCIIKRPRMSMLSKLPPAGKTRLNHFEHQSEVKAKEERRPAIADLANQKNIMQKVSGWKIQHMTNQMEQVVDLEVSVVNSFNSFLTKLESKVGPNCPDRDINRLLELLKGNIQRCKVIRDQMSESRSQALRILDHKPRIVDVIAKHMTKKPQRKKDRL